MSPIFCPQHHPNCAQPECTIGPTRDGLYRILFKHKIFPPKLSTIVDELIAWATRAGPDWCSHCRYESGVEVLNSKGWWFYGSQQALMYIPDSWDQCPVEGCHAPRPKELETEDVR